MALARRRHPEVDDRQLERRPAEAALRMSCGAPGSPVHVHSVVGRKVFSRPERTADLLTDKGAWATLDVHRDFCEVAIAEHSGDVRHAGRVATDPAEL